MLTPSRGAALSLPFLLILACSNSDGGTPTADDAGPDALADDTGDGVDGSTDAPMDARGDAPSDGPRDSAVDAPVDVTPDAPATPAVRFIGRFDRTDPAVPRFAWPGSAIVAHFSGTQVTLKLREAGNNQYDVSIDGKAPTVLIPTSAKTDYLLASGLSAGEHDVVVFKRTESFAGADAFVGFDFGAGGALLPPRPAAAHHVEMIGDSITCGYGVEGASATCPFSVDTENHALAYGALAARDLGAEEIAIAYSGKGVVRDYGGSTVDPMGVLYDRTLAEDAASTWDFSSWSADVVLIDLGTNDFASGDPGASTFTAAYRALVAKVRSHYPSAHIYCEIGPMLSDSYPVGASSLTKARTYITSVVSALNGGGDTKVHLLEFAEQVSSDGYGCDYHPSRVTQRKMADVVVAAVRKDTGW